MDYSLIAYTERRAKAHKLIYTRYLSPNRLLAQVLNIEHRAMLDLPNPDRPAPCFGVNFGGEDDGDCIKCQVQTACMLRTATKTLPDIEAEHGPGPLAAAQAIDSSLRAVELMHSLRLALAEMDDEAPLYLTHPILEGGRKRRPVTDLKPFRRNASLRAAEGANACRLSSQASQTGWPPPVAPVTSRFGHRVADCYVLQGGLTVLARNQYGNKAFQDRVRRTQDRMPELLWCPDGTILRKVHKNEVVEVTIYRDRFEYKGTAFASLAEIVAVVDGKAEYRIPPSAGGRGTRKMARISGPKFFAEPFVGLYLRALYVLHDRTSHPEKVHRIVQESPVACLSCGHDFIEELRKQAPNIRWNKTNITFTRAIPQRDANFYW